MLPAGSGGASWPAPDGSGVLCSADEEIVLVSREGTVLWRYDLMTAGLKQFSRSQVSWERSGPSVSCSSANDVLLAPSAPLTLQDVTVLTHQVSVSVPIR